MMYAFDAYGRYAGETDSTANSTDVAPPEPSSDWVWNLGEWVYAPNLPMAPTFAEPAPTKTPEQIQAEIVAAVQSRLDDFARTRNYDGILSAATYATSTVPKFQAEGQRAVELRDLTWAALYAILGQVLAGEREMPAGYADIEAELPALLWADEVQPEPAPEPVPEPVPAPTPEPTP
jgi:hypothetical protein